MGQQPHANLPPILLRAERVRRADLLALPGSQAGALPEDLAPGVGGPHLLAHQRGVKGRGRGVHQRGEHRYRVARLVVNPGRRDFQHAWSIQNRRRDLSPVQIHDRRLALQRPFQGGRRFPLQDHFRTVDGRGPRHVQRQGDRRVALRPEVGPIHARLALAGPGAAVFVVGHQLHGQSRRQRREVFRPQPERELDLSAQLHRRGAEIDARALGAWCVGNANGPAAGRRGVVGHAGSQPHAAGHD